MKLLSMYACMCTCACQGGEGWTGSAKMLLKQLNLCLVSLKLYSGAIE